MIKTELTIFHLTKQTPPLERWLPPGILALSVLLSDFIVLTNSAINAEIGCEFFALVNVNAGHI